MAERLRVALVTLGCKVNRTEGEDVSARLLGMGAELCEPDEADVIVVNTCTVTREADAKARKAVRRALSAEKCTLVLVTGCLASIDADTLRRLGPRVIVEADKSRLADIVADRFDLEAGDAVVRSGEGFRTRALVKVQDGCDARCAYCIVPDARGIPRSVPARQVVKQVESLVGAGVAEVVLTGINLGRYESGGAGLASLVKEVAGSGVARLRLSSIEPMDLTEGLLSSLAETPAVCHHLHVPLQSGSDRVLSAMRRNYSLKQYARRITEARSALQGLVVTTDVIAGLPGEGEDDAQRTLDACRELGFVKVHVFRYSERAGTPAATMPDSVGAKERAERAGRLRRLGDELRQQFLESMVGSSTEVLIETVEAGRARGTTPEYTQVSLDAEKSMRPGALVRAELLCVEGSGLRAKAL